MKRVERYEFKQICSIDTTIHGALLYIRLHPDMDFEKEQRKKLASEIRGILIQESLLKAINQ